jgi:hypothetical protein
MAPVVPPAGALPLINAALAFGGSEIVADNVKAGAESPLFAIIISNESGQDLLTIPAKDVLPEPLKG